MKQFEEKCSIDMILADKLKEASYIYESQKYTNNVYCEEYVHGLVTRKKKKKTIKLLRSVAAIVLMLLTGLSASIWFQVDGVYGGKRFIEKCINVISPLNITEETNELGEITTVITITEEEDLDVAKEEFDKLKIPAYIPDGFALDVLTIKKNKNHSSVEYIYKCDDELLVVAFEYDNTGSEIMLIGDYYKSPVTGQEMYVDEIADTNEFSVIEIRNEYDCIVLGRGDSEIGIKIIESIK